MMKPFLAAALVFLLFSCGQTPQETLEVPALSQEELVKRGKYLTTIGGCNDCHSPKVMTAHGPVPDTTRLLSGHPYTEPLPEIPRNVDWILFNPGLTAFVGPWGISYAANLTPDETGIGNWSYKQFETAIRKGKFKGLESGRNLLPPMPWEMFAALSDDDMRAIFTYLKSIQPVNNLVPSPVSPDKISLK